VSLAVDLCRMWCDPDELKAKLRVGLMVVCCVVCVSGDMAWYLCGMLANVSWLTFLVSSLTSWSVIVGVASR
jgi:hypothetical protein